MKNLNRRENEKNIPVDRRDISFDKEKFFDFLVTNTVDKMLLGLVIKLQEEK